MNVVAMRNDDTINEVLDNTRELLTIKGESYSEEPAYIVPIRDLHAQINIKALRAQMATSIIQEADELRDLIAYSTIALARLIDERGIQL
jgi:hypothetical protein